MFQHLQQLMFTYLLSSTLETKELHLLNENNAQITWTLFIYAYTYKQIPYQINLWMFRLITSGKLD